MADLDVNDKLADLLSRCALGDQVAFKMLFELTRAKLFAVSLRIVKERHLAEEILQDSFVNIWKNAGTYAVAKSAPMTWMTAVVRNRSLDWVRRPHTEVQDEDDFYTLNLEDDSPGADDRLSQNRDALRVGGCLNTLDSDQRQAVALAFFNGLSHAEVAQHLHKPLGTVKTHIRRGLMKLKDCLGDEA